MKIVIIKQDGTSRVPRKRVENCLHYFIRVLKKRKIQALDNHLQLIVVFVSMKRMKELNKQFRSRDYATDILSFSPVDSDSLGELVLSLQVIRRQSFEHCLTQKEELSYLLLHGLLHLLGFDHERSPREAQKMFDLQDLIWESYWRLRTTQMRRKKQGDNHVIINRVNRNSRSVARAQRKNR